MGADIGGLVQVDLRPSFNPPTLGTIEWGVQVGDGAGNISDSWGEYSNANLSSLGGNALGTSNSISLGSGTLFEDALCPDADITGNTAGAPVQYFNDLADVISNGFTLNQVTMLRASGNLGSGKEVALYFGLQLRNTFQFDATDVLLNPPGPALVYQAGDPIPSGSHVPNMARISFNGNPLVQIARDAFEVKSNHFLRLDKSAVPVSGNQVNPGQLLTYRLQANYTTPDFGAPADVTVTDVLPPGISYVNTLSGPTATVMPDTPAVGFTTVSWVIQNATPASTVVGDAAGDLALIEFTARVNTDVTAGEQLHNWATVSDGGLDADSDPDCVYDAGNDPSVGYSACTTSYSSTPVKADNTVHNVLAPPGFQIFKDTSDPIISPGSDVAFQINWSPIGASAADFRVIDIFPWNGDARGSSYNGTLQLSSATATGDLMGASFTLYYTLAAPASIDLDPFDAGGTNALGGLGSTLWCDTGDDATSPDVGTAGCPATIADATAILVNQTSQLVAGGNYGLELSYSTSGNMEGDIYINNHSGNDSGVGAQPTHRQFSTKFSTRGQCRQSGVV